MIARLSGTVWSIGDGHIVVRVGGIGLQVHVPFGVLAQLDGVGQPVELFTHLHVRENDLALYGFLTEEELALFKLLLSISGVGPKVALALLSTVSPDALRQAVVQDEPGILSRVPGIGPKTAKAIIFHLKDKLAPVGVEAAPLLSEADAEVIAALTGLGFSLVEAQAALQSLPRDEDLSIEERVRRALAYFAVP
ncbi:MAG: Holliday junction branch migration protein RuvA [Chloroflexi bacterium]|nr:MAG: Holliday junction branch migration protein RuvA [Chloroflexota bacterium]RLC86849.1 MAG: Holliday junction branch migration protein RuvA [Chloroflexota bacterium]HEY68912.1 Holliday junction branch migration protein RuvA [Thermoflexia bacterium]